MKEVTIVTVNYRTPQLTKLCMRSLRKYTDLERVRIIVIDNDSNDESLEYLRGLSWIELIERKNIAGETPPESHSKALNEGLKLADTPYLFVMHTDTIIIREGWLDYLLNQIQSRENIAGVGSWKMEKESPTKEICQEIETFIRVKLLGKEDKRHRALYLRSHGALYRTDLLRKYTDGFFDGDTAGRSAHLKLEKAGFEMCFLPVKELIRYMLHLNHATMILNPEISGRRTGTSKAQSRIAKEMNRLELQRILEADELDKA